MDRFSLLAAQLHTEVCTKDHTGDAFGIYDCTWEIEEEYAKEETKPINWKKGTHGQYYKLAKRIHSAVKSIWK